MHQYSSLSVKKNGDQVLPKAAVKAISLFTLHKPQTFMTQVLSIKCSKSQICSSLPCSCSIGSNERDDAPSCLMFSGCDVGVVDGSCEVDRLKEPELSSLKLRGMAKML